MLDDRSRIVAADHAPGVVLKLARHPPGLGEVLVRHARELGNVATHVRAAGVEAPLLEDRVVESARRWLRIDADRSDPLPVAVVAGLVAVEEEAHEPALAPTPIDAEVLG